MCTNAPRMPVYLVMLWKVLLEEFLNRLLLVQDENVFRHLSPDCQLICPFARAGLRLGCPTPTRRSGFPHVRQVAHAEFPILAPDGELALERIKQPESGAVHGVRPQQVAAGQQAQLG